MVEPGLLDENITDAADRSSFKEPLSAAELQIRYDEAVSSARRKRTDLLAQIERDQDGKGTRLDWDSYWRFRDWLRDLDLEAPGIQEELEKAKAELMRLGKDEIASDVGSLGYECSLIDYYRVS